MPDDWNHNDYVFFFCLMFVMTVLFGCIYAMNGIIQWR